MTHGSCCNCFICKIGKALGLIQECTDDCCKPETKKTKVKKSVAVSKQKPKVVAKKKKTVKKK